MTTSTIPVQPEKIAELQRRLKLLHDVLSAMDTVTNMVDALDELHKSDDDAHEMQRGHRADAYAAMNVLLTSAMAMRNSAHDDLAGFLAARPAGRAGRS